MSQMLETYLNDDCVYLILKKLRFHDQLAVAQAYRHFHILLIPIWQKEYQSLHSLRHWTRTYEDFAILMESICCTLQEIEFEDLTHEQFNIMRLYSFPQVRRLILRNPQAPCDSSILEMTKIFPNLRSFTPKTNDMSGKHMENWRCLKNLDLSSCQGFHFHQFQRILEANQLKTIKFGPKVFNTRGEWTSELAIEKFSKLERISFYIDKEPWLTDPAVLFSMKLIEIVSVENEKFLLDMYTYTWKYKRNDLIEIQLEIVFPIDGLRTSTFKNLKKFHLCCGWYASFIVDILKRAPNLNEIVIMNCQELVVTFDIFDWLYCDNITLISIEGCACEFPELELKVRDIVARRTTSVIFNFHRNRFWSDSRQSSFTVTLDVKGESPLFKVTSKEIYNTNLKGRMLFR